MMRENNYKQVGPIGMVFAIIVLVAILAMVSGFEF